MTLIRHDQLPLQRIWHHEITSPDLVYLTQPWPGGHCTDYTWKQAVHQSRCIAAHIAGLNLPAGSSISIISKNCAHWLMADMAIWMAGHVSVPLYPTLTRQTVRQILEHSEAKLVFVGKLDDEAEITAGIPDGTHVIHLPVKAPDANCSWNEIVNRNEPLKGQPVCEASALATIVYTSGTTGMPKGVMHSHATLAWAGVALKELLDVTENDRAISYLPLSHVAERAALQTLSLQSRMRVYFTESLDTFLQDLRRAKPTVFFSVPRLWVKFQQGVTAKLPEKKLRRLLSIPIVSGLVKKKILTQLGLEHVRIAGSGAAPTPEAVMGWYRMLGLKLLEAYGMSEIFGLSHLSRPDSIRTGYVGQTIPDVDCKLSEQGEVLLKSQGNTLGYYKEPEKTAELFTEDGYIRTGDRGTIDELGRLRITGRVKEIFKTSKGKYVAPAPIENRLTAHSDIEACCVTIGENEAQPLALLMLSEAGKKRLADTTAHSSLAADLETHLADVNAALDEHERLAFAVVCQGEWTVDNGLVTPTLKVKRHQIEATYGGHMTGWYRAKKRIQFE